MIEEINTHLINTYKIVNAVIKINMYEKLQMQSCNIFILLLLKTLLNRKYVI